MIQGVQVQNEPSPTPPPVRTSAPPNPLPDAWARALANDIAERLTRDGWQREDQLRAWSATGNPTTHRYSSGGRFPSVLPTTEFLNRDLYTWGTIDPDDYPGIDIPPLAYVLAQLDLAAVITRRADATALLGAAQGWLVKCRRAARSHRTTPHVYRLKPNRHGNFRLQRRDDALVAEAEAFTLAAQAAKVRVIDDFGEFEDALADPEFQATAALAVLQKALGVSLASESC